MLLLPSLNLRSPSFSTMTFKRRNGLRNKQGRGPRQVHPLLLQLRNIVEKAACAVRDVEEACVCL